jgi:hypothetical protein
MSSQPAPFQSIPSGKVVLPNPRTVRSQDLTWFNTRGGEIITTNYNKCDGKIKNRKTPWNRSLSPPNIPFWTCPVPRFDLYGLSNCPCQLNRCGCSDCASRPRCALFGGSYVDPN